MKDDRSVDTQSGTLKHLLARDSAQEHVLVEALKECQSNIDAGTPINRRALLAKYQTVREELAECIDSLELFRQLDPASEDSQVVINAAVPPKPPSTPIGDFRIVREIGRGGMGVVYEAEQLSVGRKVALKVLPYAAMLDKQQVARFQNEARAAATLEHPHIVPVHFVGNERGVYYYAMRLISGKNLAEILAEMRCGQNAGEGSSDQGAKRTNPRTLAISAGDTKPSFDGDTKSASSAQSGANGRAYIESIVKLGSDIADALDFAHAHGIVHRDVKPANIMLDDVGDAWITDFGLARIEADGGMTMTGGVIGTLRYMSPEQSLALRATVDHRSDVYSLGATLYELLTLQPLFDGSNRAEILRKIASDEPKAPSRISKDIPRDLETIILKALQKDPLDRYATASDLAADLRRFLAHQPVQARRTPSVQRARMWTRRHPTVSTALVAVTAVAFASVAAIGFLYARFEHQARSRQDAATKRVEEALALAHENLALAGSEKTRADKKAQEATELKLLAERKSERLRQQLYVRDLQRAYEAYNHGWHGQVSDLLAKYETQEGQVDYRGFEWRILQHLVWYPESQQLLGHNGAVRDIALLGGRTQLASSGDDGTIRVWDLHSHKELYRLENDPKQFSPADWFLRQVMAGQGNLADPALRTLAVAPGGDRLATGSVSLALWDLNKRNIERQLDIFPTTIRGVAFSPDGKLLAAHSADEELRVFDLAGGRIATSSTNAGTCRIAFSPDGQYLVAPFSDKSKNLNRRGVRRWEVDNWASPDDFQLNVVPRGMAISADSHYLYCGSPHGNLLGLELATGKKILETTQQRSSVSDVAVSPNSHLVASSHDDGTIGVVQLPRPLQSRNSADLLEPRLFPQHDGAANAVRFLDDKRLVSCGQDGIIRITQIGESQVKQSFTTPTLYNRCQFLPHSQELVVTTVNGFSTFDSRDCSLKRSVTLWPMGTGGADVKVFSLATDADGATIALGNSDGEIAIYDTALDEITSRFTQTDLRVSGITDMTFSPDGKWFVNGSRDHTIRIRETKSWNETRRIWTKGWGTNVEFSPDGSILAYSDSDGNLGVIETATWGEIAATQALSGLDENTLRFTPNGKTLITGHKDSTIRLWNVRDLSLVSELKGHAHKILGLALRADGRTLVSVGADKTVRIWHMPTRTLIGTLANCKSSTWDCHFSTSGNQLAVCAAEGRSGVCHTWDLSKSALTIK